MVKRKADGVASSGSGRGKEKEASRPPPPSRRDETNDDDDDSDFCEVIEPPPRNTTTHTCTSSSSSGSSVNSSMSLVGMTHAPSSNGGHLGFPAMIHHGQSVAGSQEAVFSVLAAAGLSNPYGNSMQHQYDMQPSNSNHGMLQMQMSQHMGHGGYMPAGLPGQAQAFPFGGSAGLYDPPVPVGLQSQGYHMGGFAPPPSAMPLPVVGEPLANPTPAIPRSREGAGVEEVKEEPDDTALHPTPIEIPMVHTLKAHGIPPDDAVQSLRLKGHNVQEALKHALRMLCDRENSRNEDIARYASEQEKEKLAATRRQEDMELTVLGDIAPRFQQSLLLDKEHGCAVFRRAIHEMCSGQEECTPAMCALREKAVQLLFLERDAFKWYRDVQPQVRGYFRQLSDRLTQFAPAGDAGVRDGPGNGAPGQPPDKRAVTAPSASVEGGVGLESSGENKSNGKSKQVDQEVEMRALTAQVVAEVEILRDILFKIPSTSGGVPDAFLECSEQSTLDVDGVEELRHESAAESRSNRRGGQVVVLDDDDG